MDARLKKILDLVPQIQQARLDIRAKAPTSDDLARLRTDNPDLRDLFIQASDMFTECMGLIDELTDDMGLETVEALHDFTQAMYWLDGLAQTLLRHTVAGQN